MFVTFVVGRFLVYKRCMRPLIITILSRGESTDVALLCKKDVEEEFCTLTDCRPVAVLSNRIQTKTYFV